MAWAPYFARHVNEQISHLKSPGLKLNVKTLNLIYNTVLIVFTVTTHWVSIRIKVFLIYLLLKTTVDHKNTQVLFCCNNSIFVTFFLMVHDCSLAVRQSWGRFMGAHLWKPRIPGERLYFLLLEHEVSPPAGDIKAALSPAQLRRQQWHTERPHTPLSSHMFPFERCCPHLTPSVLVFFLPNICVVLSLRATLTSAPNLIFSSLFLWDCHFYSPFYQQLFPTL